MAFEEIDHASLGGSRSEIKPISKTGDAACATLGAWSRETRMNGRTLGWRAAIAAPALLAASAALAAPTAAMLRESVDWLVADFGLPRPAAEPRIVLASPSRIAAIRYGGLLAPPGRRETIAAYDRETRTIYLPLGWTGATPAERSMLVHELVHHLQASAGLRYACPEASEDLAYAAQAKWLARFGRSLHGEFGIDGFTLLASVQCLW
jgi:hypothetical protein